VWPDRLLIELKTERGSHGAAQLPYDGDLALHHFPNRLIDLVYITPNHGSAHCVHRQPLTELGRRTGTAVVLREQLT